MKKRSRKLLSALLALALFATTVPVAPVMAAQESGQAVLAEDGTGNSAEVGTTNEPIASAGEGKYWDKENGKWVPKEIPPNATEITANNLPTTWTSDGPSDGYYIVKGKDLTIGSRVTVTGDVHLILADKASLTVNSGIQVQGNEGDNLTICAQSTEEGTMGTLTATGSTDHVPSISGSVTINGGTVTAKGNSKYAIGIGGSIIIEGGTVTATGGEWGHGIGGDSITITGGTVTATGGLYGFGITSSSTTVITGGTVTVTGGAYAGGIGGKSTTINGGKISASINNHGATGIGGDSVTINGGTVTVTMTIGVDGTTATGIGGDSITINGGTVTATGDGPKVTGIGGDSIAINGGTVTATSEGSEANGIGNSSDDNSSNVKITGGVVTAKGTIEGINGQTFSTGDDGSAVIIASSISDKSNKEHWSGLIITPTEGEGKIYGDTPFTLPEDIDIPAGYTLTIDEGKTLTIPEGVTLTNNGTIINKGDITKNGTIEGNQPIVPVTGVTLDKTSLTLTEGDTDTLTATVAPANATNKTVIWSSSDTSVATVENGKVTAVGKGDATITVTTVEGSFPATCTVTVKVPVTEVSLNQTTMDLKVGESGELTATVEPADATNKNVAWTSSNESVATVDANGNVTAVSEGTAIITVTTADGNKTATCTVNVKSVPVESVTLNKTSLSLTEGESAQLTATVMPENATNKAVTWTSSDQSIATVDADGTVKAVKAGTATITATAGEAEATCIVTVAPPFSGHYTYPVNVAETEHGSILLAKENHYAADGEKVAFTVVPDEGYATDTVTVTTKAGKDVAVTDEGEGIYTFTMPTSEVTLAATFVETEEPEPELPFTDVSEDELVLRPSALGILRRPYDRHQRHRIFTKPRHHPWHDCERALSSGRQP